MVFDSTAGEIGLTPKYDITDLPVMLDRRECEEFFLANPPVYTVSTNFNAPCAFIVNLP